MKTASKTITIALIGLLSTVALVNTATAQPNKFRKNSFSVDVANTESVRHSEGDSGVVHTHRRGGGSPRTVRNDSDAKSGSFKTNEERSVQSNAIRRVGPRAKHRFTTDRLRTEQVHVDDSARKVRGGPPSKSRNRRSVN